MMLLICIAWILVMANAPWWVWSAFCFHILGSVLAWLFKDNKQLDDLIDKLR